METHTKPTHMNMTSAGLIAYWESRDTSVLIQYDSIRPFLTEHGIDPDQFFAENPKTANWQPPDEGEVKLSDGRVLDEYGELLTAEVVLGYDRGDLSDWFIDLYVPCDGESCGQGDEHDAADRKHRVAHQYVSHDQLLLMFEDAYSMDGSGLKGIARLFPERA